MFILYLLTVVLVFVIRQRFRYTWRLSFMLCRSGVSVFVVCAWSVFCGMIYLYFNHVVSNFDIFIHALFFIVSILFSVYFVPSRIGSVYFEMPFDVLRVSAGKKAFSFLAKSEYRQRVLDFIDCVIECDVYLPSSIIFKSHRLKPYAADIICTRLKERGIKYQCSVYHLSAKERTDLNILYHERLPWGVKGFRARETGIQFIIYQGHRKLRGACPRE